MSVEENIKARKEAEAARAAAIKEAEEIIELLGEKSQAFWAVLGAMCDSKLPRPEPKPETPAAPKREKKSAPDVESVLEQCDRILEKIERLPSRADEFGESVTEKIKSIAETIEHNDYTTPGQQQALDNMEGGVDRWLNRE